MGIAGNQPATGKFEPGTGTAPEGLIPIRASLTDPCLRLAAQRTLEKESHHLGSGIRPGSVSV
ncbi:hypothetical protein GCM10025795_54280 [Verticiella sediminum]